MFDQRGLSGELAAVRETHAPGALVVDAESDFETLPPALAENLLAVADSLDPLSYEAAWVPADAPEALGRLASGEFTVGAPGDGGVVRTRQTDPPTVIVKPRLEGSPEGFVDFLVAEALLEAGLGLPEQFLGFFEDDYRALDERSRCRRPTPTSSESRCSTPTSASGRARRSPAGRASATRASASSCGCPTSRGTSPSAGPPSPTPRSWPAAR